jgi:LmbE family N-acetylglucosaminyl deacetylase
MKICIVSPHIDDAILSCGILMQRCKALGDEVLSLNIFTAGTNAENRQKEERLAAEKIGAQPFFLDELDAPDRNPLYQSTIKLFFGPFEDIPEHYIAKIEKIVSDFFSTHKIDIAYFPLAAGTHIDHRIAYTVGRRIRNTPVKFYEDRPYVLWQGILQGRMNEIGSDAVLPEVTGSMMQDTLNSHHFLTDPEGIFRDGGLQLYFSALKRKSAGALKSKSETLVATAGEVRKLYDCLASYESQMKYLYPDYDAFIKESFAYEQGNSGKTIYAERFWAFF